MLTYSFENIGSQHLYEYLYHCIKTDIINGVISSGEKLPSKRSFAKNLGISTITVENAYEQLIAEGYIYSVAKKGYYVADITIIETLHPLQSLNTVSNDTKYYNASANQDNFISNNNYSATQNNLTSSNNYPAAQNNLISNNNYPATQNTIMPNNTAFAAQANFLSSNDTYQSYKIDLTSNKTPVAMFPFYTWSKYLREVITNQSDALLQACPSGGIYDLRCAISHHLRDFRGMTVNPEQIIIGAGTEYLYGLIIQLLGRNYTFAMEEPCYSKIRKIYKSNDVVCKSIIMDEQGVDIHALYKSNANIIHISPSHHFPTGIVTSIKRRYELLSWAMNNKDRYIIEDDYDSEFRLSGKPIPSLQSIDKTGHVIYINTFTKSLTPTIRISYMILPNNLLHLFNKKLGFYSCTVSNFEQYTLARFIETGHFEKHINRMRLYYRKQRNQFIDALEHSPIADKITIDKADSGIHFLIKIDTNLSDKQLIERAYQNGLKFSCLSDYYENSIYAKNGIIVINYSALSSENINTTVKLLCKTILHSF